MTIIDVAPPEVEPLTLDYAKTFLRVDTGDDDALITDLIRAARERIETMINGALITRQRRLTTRQFSRNGLCIHHHPVLSIHAIRAADHAGAHVDVALEDVAINLRCQPPIITLKNHQAWQNLLSGTAYIEVDFTAGFGAAADDIPMPLRQAVMLLLAQSYEFRGDSDGPPTPMLVDALLMPYRVVRL